MSLTERVDRRTAGLGAAAGAGAYLLGYLVVYLTQSGSVEERLRGINFVAELLGGDPIPAWKAVGWLFYNAHFVETTVPSLAGTRTVNFLAEAGSPDWLYLLAPLLLVAAGFAIAYLSDARAPGPSGVVGVLAVVGYLPLAALGIALFGYGVGDGSIAPDAVTAVLLAGAVYPILFGAIGGVLGGRL
jgi:hypothetical protein